MLDDAQHVDALSGAASSLPGEVKAWLFPCAIFLFYLYPCALLAWTVLEGMQAGRSSATPHGARCLRRCCLRSDGPPEVKQQAERSSEAGGRNPRSSEDPEPKEACSDACQRSSRRCLYRTSVLDPLVKVVVRCSNFVQPVSCGAAMVVFCLRLIFYSLMLSPWFLQIGYKYFHDPRIRRGIRYGSKPRNYLDIYFPAEAMLDVVAGSAPKFPVVVTVMGGGWVIGHRLWNVLLGMRLAQAGVLVVGVDYRNFPAAHMGDMVKDVDSAIGWVLTNISSYGGDTGNVVLIGQSAGAHLEALALVERSIAEAQGIGGPTAHSWLLKDIKGFFGISGPYDLVALQAHLKLRGVYPFLPHLCVDGDIATYSPTRLLASIEWNTLPARSRPKMPPVYLFSGQDDRSVPPTSSVCFAKALQDAGFPEVTVELRPGMRHAEPVVEDPLTGGDVQVKLVLPLLLDATERCDFASLPPPYPQVPKCIARLALRIMPF